MEMVLMGNIPLIGKGIAFVPNLFRLVSSDGLKGLIGSLGLI